MKIKSILFLLLLAFPVFAVSQKTNYVGYQHKGVVYGKNLPNGVKDLGGGLLSNEDYGVSRYTKNGNDMLWLEKILSRDAKGVPTWQVKDVLMLDKLRKNQELLFSYSSTCTINGRESLNLIVLAELAGNKKSFKILKAWHASVENEKFKKISISGIRCEVDGN
ncbi:MAG TPA: hypothetical protein VF692_00220 [Pyrinomonadaceae bacterium]|jgi:hypothetical protein